MKKRYTARSFDDIWSTMRIIGGSSNAYKEDEWVSSSRKAM